MKAEVRPSVPTSEPKELGGRRALASPLIVLGVAAGLAFVWYYAPSLLLLRQLEGPAVGTVGMHHSPLEVEVVHVGQQGPGVALLLDDAPQRGGDQAEQPIAIVVEAQRLVAPFEQRLADETLQRLDPAAQRRR